MLQPQDHLVLRTCRASSEVVSVLSDLELAYFYLNVPVDTAVVALPLAPRIHLDLSVMKWAHEYVSLDEDGIPMFTGHVHWGAVVSASRELQITCDACGAHAVCSKKLHVNGAPAHSWQDTLSLPGRPWRCTALGWDSVSGMASCHQ